MLGSLSPALPVDGIGLLSNRKRSAASCGRYNAFCKKREFCSKIELPYTSYTRPAYSDGYLYVPINNGSEFLNEIVQIDTKTLERKTIFKSNLDQPTINSLMSSKNWLTWEVSESNGANGVIYAHNRQTGQTKEIAKSAADIVKINAPFLEDQAVAWIDSRKDGHRVVWYDLQNDRLEEIETVKYYGLYNNFVHIQNQVVHWTDSIDGIGHYFYYNIHTKELTRQASPFEFPGYSKLSGNRTFAIHFKDHRRWSAQTFGYYEPAENKIHPLSDRYINAFAVSKRHLAVLTHKQELAVYRDTKEGVVPVELPLLHTHLDSIDFTPDGTLIAGYRDDAKRNLVLFLVTLD